MKGQRCLEEYSRGIFEEKDAIDDVEATEEDDENTFGEVTEYTLRDVEAEDMFIFKLKILQKKIHSKIKSMH